MLLSPMFVEVGSNLVYAAIQQLGGTVKPTRKYLAIPVPPSLRRRGVWPRDLPSDQLKFVPDANIKIGSRRWIGPALVRAKPVEIETPFDGAGKKTKGNRARSKEGEVLFALVKKVTIKGRPYLVFDRKARNFLFHQIGIALLRAVRRGGRR
jgi:phage gpG-like protein